MKALRILNIILSFKGSKGLDEYGVDLMDCEACFATSTNSFCMPYEAFTGVD